MRSVYHIVPSEMVGKTLYPLNDLKSRHPYLYEKAIAKYHNDPARIALLSRVIPKLNCLWNDVVQCAPIHPHHIYTALVESGMRVSPDIQFFQIPIDPLKAREIVIYDGVSGRRPDEPFTDEEVNWLDIATHRELEYIPERTLTWYDQLASQGRIGAFFHGIPHIMVHGAIDVSVAAIIQWGTRPNA